MKLFIFLLITFCSLAASAQRPFNPDSLREHRHHFTQDSIHRHMIEMYILHFANAQLITTDSSEHILDTVSATTDRPLMHDVRIKAYCNKTEGEAEYDIVVRNNGNILSVGHQHTVTNWQPPAAAPVAQLYIGVRNNKVCILVRGQIGQRIKWVLGKKAQP